MTVSAEASFLTPTGSGGIGVVVVSGADAESVIESVFEGGIPGPGALKYGVLVDPQTGDPVDEILCRRGLSSEVGGSSVFEIDGHGGQAGTRERGRRGAA